MWKQECLSSTWLFHVFVGMFSSPWCAPVVYPHSLSEDSLVMSGIWSLVRIFGRWYSGVLSGARVTTRYSVLLLLLAPVPISYGVRQTCTMWMPTTTLDSRAGILSSCGFHCVLSTRTSAAFGQSVIMVDFFVGSRVGIFPRFRYRWGLCVWLMRIFFI